MYMHIYIAAAEPQQNCDVEREIREIRVYIYAYIQSCNRAATELQHREKDK